MSADDIRARLDALEARLAALEATLAERAAAEQRAKTVLAEEIRTLRAPLEQVASRQGGPP